jgi:BirA family transcriptional regulator, biotin operon repressor / biotin---[acetyl-CoA-carboxylase] ligase
MMRFAIQFHNSLGSTQDEARRLAESGAAHGTVVAACEQTAGRGRHGRQWASPPGNVYLSMLLRLDLPRPRLAELGFVTALAVADTVDAHLPGRATLKWPNDVLVDGAKISGILIEHAEDTAIIGIGLNVLQALDEAPYPVTSLSALVGCADLPSRGWRTRDVDTVREALLGAFARRLDAWHNCGFGPVRSDWLRRAHPVGTSLHVSTSDGAIEGSFAGLGDDGALLMATDRGVRRLLAGDVSIRFRNR